MIPEWNSSQVLPPIRPGQDTQSSDRSPYHVSINEIAERFCFNAERTAILRGLLAYREALRSRGVQNGFQWIDGSFTENKEKLELKAPEDVDVITFFELPPGETQDTFKPKVIDLFTEDSTKARFHVHPVPFVLGNPMQYIQVRKIAYWYSMWSHRRNGLWKGFLQISMALEQDSAAIDFLNSREIDGGVT